MKWKVVQVVCVLGLAARGVEAQPRFENPPVLSEQPDAERTRREFSQLLSHYPPALRQVFSIDPALLNNQAYLAPYPALVSYLGQHPEVARSPSFYVGNYASVRFEQAQFPRRNENIHEIITDLSIFSAFCLAVGLITWLIRTLIDYRRWSRLSKVQTEVHTKILDRFTNNDDLRTYIQSPAGARFLESAPISLDSGPRSMSAPLGRILWSLQAGLVVGAAGVGLQFAAPQIADESAQAMHVLGILGMALGAGFVVSAAFSFLISQRLGLIGNTKHAALRETPET